MSYRCFQITKNLVVLEFAPQTRTVIIGNKCTENFKSYNLLFPYTVFFMPVAKVSGVYEMFNYAMGFCEHAIKSKSILYAPPLPNIFSGNAYSNLEVCSGSSSCRTSGTNLKEAVLKIVGSFWQSKFSYAEWADEQQYLLFLDKWQVSGNWKYKIESIRTSWEPGYASSLSEILRKRYGITTLKLVESNLEEN